MGSHPYDHYEGEQDELRRYGLDRDPREDHAHEVELAERIAEQASLPPGQPGVWALARYRLGRGPSPFERRARPWRRHHRSPQVRRSPTAARTAAVRSATEPSGGG